MKSKENLISAWAVLLGVIVAIILGIFQATISSQAGWVYALLAIIGIIVGLASVGEESKESTTFLLATMSLVIVSYMGQSTLTLVGDVGLLIGTILNGLLTMFIPATIIVALKTVFSVASFN
ncbi:MAG: hypothetical protein WC781_04195 [Candidatus Pacearchaeota archaeon]|jgi:hypothetical protein